jgi:hypothetical protein
MSVPGVTSVNGGDECVKPLIDRISRTRKAQKQHKVVHRTQIPKRSVSPVNSDLYQIRQKSLLQAESRASVKYPTTNRSWIRAIANLWTDIKEKVGRFISKTLHFRSTVNDIQTSCYSSMDRLEGSFSSILEAETAKRGSYEGAGSSFWGDNSMLQCEGSESDYWGRSDMPTSEGAYSSLWGKSEMLMSEGIRSDLWGRSDFSLSEGTGSDFWDETEEITEKNIELNLEKTKKRKRSLKKSTKKSKRQRIECPSDYAPISETQAHAIPKKPTYIRVSKNPSLVNAYREFEEKVREQEAINRKKIEAEEQLKELAAKARELDEKQAAQTQEVLLGSSGSGDTTEKAIIPLTGVEFRPSQDMSDYIYNVIFSASQEVNEISDSLREIISTCQVLGIAMSSMSNNMSISLGLYSLIYKQMIDTSSAGDQQAESLPQAGFTHEFAIKIQEIQVALDLTQDPELLERIGATMILGEFPLEIIELQRQVTETEILSQDIQDGMHKVEGIFRGQDFVGRLRYMQSTVRSFAGYLGEEQIEELSSDLQVLEDGFHGVSELLPEIRKQIGYNELGDISNLFPTTKRELPQIAAQ